MLNIGAFFPLLFLAAERLPGGVAATLGAAQPLLVAALAVAVLHDRPTAWRLAWGVIGVAGVGLVVLGPGVRLDAVGVLAGLGGTAVMAGGVVLTKRWGRPPGVGPLTLAGRSARDRSAAEERIRGERVREEQGSGERV